MSSTLWLTAGLAVWRGPVLPSSAPAQSSPPTGICTFHGENGDVALVEATEDAYMEKGRFTPPHQPQHATAMEKAWPSPVVANGRLYIRDRGTLWSYDVAGRK